MNKQQVIKRFCKLASEVASIKFHNGFASDCFCGLNKLKIGDFRFEEKVFQFIEEAVKEKLNK